jgi:molybdopterin converting factor small subunit
MFAALREAAGAGEVVVEPGPLPAVLGGLRRRYGEPFSSRLAVSSVLLEGSSVSADADVVVPDGAELALLPPVSGGARPGDRATAVIAATVLAAAAAALVAGPGAFGAAAVLLAGLVLLDSAALLRVAGPRPLIPAGLVSGVGLPWAVTLAPAAPHRLPVWIAAGTLAAFALMIASPRRRGASVALGTTLFAGLLVGLGAGCLLLLRGLPGGFRWVAGLLALIFVAEVAAGAAARGAANRRATATAAVVAVGLAAAVLTVTLNPPYTAAPAAAVAAVALCASRLARGLRSRIPDPRSGRLLRVTSAALLGAPPAYLLVVSAVAPASG